MEDRGRPGLNNPVIRARLTQTHRRTGSVNHIPYSQPSTPVAVPETLRPVISTINIVAPQPYSRPAHTKLQQSNVLRRQSVRKPSRLEVNFDPQYVEMQKPLKPKLKLAVIGLVILGVLVGVGSAINMFAAKDGQTSPAAVVEAGANQDSANPNLLSELKPTANALSSYSVPANEPKILTIPRLYVYARIKPVGLNNNNELRLTNNIFDAGWSSASAKPGNAEKNVTVLNGHMAGPSQSGLFAKLSTLIAGDSIKVTRGDGQSYLYNVVKVQTLEPGNVNPGLMSMPAEAGKSGLNLVGCEGDQTLAVGDCRQRTIVFAVKSS